MAKNKDIFDAKVKPIAFQTKKEENSFWGSQTKALSNLRKRFSDETILDKRVPVVDNLLFLFSEANLAILTQIELRKTFNTKVDEEVRLGEDCGRERSENKKTKKDLIYG